MIESGADRMDVRFCFDGDSAVRRNTDPRHRGHLSLSEDLSMAFQAKSAQKMNQSWSVGLSILEISKWIMQRNMYYTIKPTFGGRVGISLTDTDSWVIIVEAANEDEVVEKLLPIMDTSNYPSEHKFYKPDRKNRLGYLKNELPCENILEVVAVRSKCYAIRTANSLHAKCKGVKRQQRDRIPFDIFKETVTGGEPVQHEITQYTLQGKNHVNRLLQQRKVAFSSFDDKRHLLCSRHSVPYGSKIIRMSEEAGQCFFCANPSMLC